MQPTRRKLLQTLGGSAAGAALGSLAPLAVHGAAASKGLPSRAMPFDLAAIKLLPGPFKTAQQLDSQYLLSLEPDRLLHNFRVNAGLPPKAPVYGGWESQEPWVDIRCHGHTLGHFLSACSMMFAATGEPAFRQRIDYIIVELQACQESGGNGLICAFPDGATPLENSLAGKPFAGVPWYTQHKIFAGLRDAHLYAGNDAALGVLKRLTEWTANASQGVPDDRLQKMLDREHGGMSEVLADVHVLTGDPTYLALAERFAHRALLDPLAESRDTLDGLHSNTQIPKVIGFSSLYDLTGKPAYGDAASFFWQTVERRSFATGGNGDGEHFFPPAEVARHMHSAKTMETCCAHNMLRLTRALFQRQPSVAYADYYERALYNSILASQDPQSGMMTYFQATRPGYVKLYCTPTDSFWCCTGSGMENHAKYGDSIYFHDAGSLYVNLFIASELTWTGKKLRITQTTTFPDEEVTRLRFHAAAPTRLNLKIRHPSWCSRATVKINGRQRAIGNTPGRYVEVDRTWRDGDVVEVHLPMRLRLEPLPNAPEFVAAMYGPIVLAGRLGNEGLSPGADIIVNERKSGDMLNLPMSIPQLRADAPISRTSAPSLSFMARALQPDRGIELVPWHRIAHERYALYWNLAPQSAGLEKQ
ncbi:MAG: beta-L-arabinofuranosidase domain-containing protein [Pseudomonadota bacterium]